MKRLVLLVLTLVVIMTGCGADEPRYYEIDKCTEEGDNHQGCVVIREYTDESHDVCVSETHKTSHLTDEEKEVLYDGCIINHDGNKTSRTWVTRIQ